MSRTPARIRRRIDRANEDMRVYRRRFLGRVWRLCRPTNYQGLRTLQQRLQEIGVYSPNTAEKDVRSLIVAYWWKCHGLPKVRGHHWSDISRARQAWIIRHGFAGVLRQWAQQRGVA